MMQIKQQTYNQINGLLGSENETLVISGTPNGGAKVFSAVFSPFRDKYPSVKLTYLEGYNRQTLQYIREGRADLGIAAPWIWILLISSSPIPPNAKWSCICPLPTLLPTTPQA